MKLEGKKMLTVRALGVAKNRVIFNVERLSEIKEAITKQDIKDLHASGAIMIRNVKGRRKIVKRKTRRRSGSVRKKVNSRKRDYITITRKLRKYVLMLKNRERITKEEFHNIRKEIRAKSFRSLAHMKERLQHLKEKK